MQVGSACVPLFCKVASLEVASGLSFGGSTRGSCQWVWADHLTLAEMHGWGKVAAHPLWQR